MLRPRWLLVSVGGVLFTIQSVQAQSIPELTPEQKLQISRDLTPRNSQDFFRQGQAQLEQEIRLLDRRVLSSDQTVLKIDPTLRDSERLQPFSPYPIPLRPQFHPQK